MKKLVRYEKNKYIEIDKRNNDINYKFSNTKDFEKFFIENAIENKNYSLVSILLFSRDMKTTLFLKDCKIKDAGFYFIIEHSKIYLDFNLRLNDLKIKKTYTPRSIGNILIVEADTSENFSIHFTFKKI